MTFYTITNLVGTTKQDEGLLSGEFTGTADLRNEDTGECIVGVNVIINDMGAIDKGSYPFRSIVNGVYKFGAQ